MELLFDLVKINIRFQYLFFKPFQANSYIFLAYEIDCFDNFQIGKQLKLLALKDRDR